MTQRPLPRLTGTTLGERLVEAYKNVGLNRNRLSKLLSIDYAAIMEWEKDNSMPMVGSLIAVAKATGYSLDELIGLDTVGVDARVERDEPESFVIWEKSLAPKRYDPQRHRARLIGMGFLYPPSEAYKWTRPFELLIDEEDNPPYTPSPTTAAMAAESDATGYKKLPKSPPKKKR